MVANVLLQNQQADTTMPHVSALASQKAARLTRDRGGGRREVKSNFLVKH